MLEGLPAGFCLPWGRAGREGAEEGEGGQGWAGEGWGAGEGGGQERVGTEGTGEGREQEGVGGSGGDRRGQERVGGQRWPRAMLPQGQDALHPPCPVSPAPLALKGQGFREPGLPGGEKWP